MASQGLIAPVGTSLEVVRRLVGLQAQDEWVAKYALRPRATSVDESGLIKTWLMRGTLHVVAKQDVRWLLDLLGPRFIARQRGRRHQLGLTDELLKEALPIVADSAPGTREELVAAVRKRGIAVAAGQAEAYLVATAALSGLIHRTATGYERLTVKGSPVDDPLTELGRRYLAGYGPAEPEDFAAWSGLSLTDARKALAGLEQPSSAKADLPTKMLGHWDPWLLGYKDRSFTLDPAHAKHLQRGGGFLQPIILVNGRVEGTWSREGKKIVVTSFGKKLPDLGKEISSLEAIS